MILILKYNVPKWTINRIVNSSIMAGVNRWLSDHPEVSVWKCETVHRTLTSGPAGEVYYDLNTMIRFDGTFGYTVFLKGVRYDYTLEETSPTNKTSHTLGLS